MPRLSSRNFSRLSCLSLMLFVTAACGDDPSTDDNSQEQTDLQDQEFTCLQASGEGLVVLNGLIYEDTNNSDRSRYLQGFEADTDEPLDGVAVSLLWRGNEISGNTCDDGTFVFEDVEDGYYLIDYGLRRDIQISSNNWPRRLPTAIREGEVSFVTIGDSLPIYGDEPYFPELVTDYLSYMATVQNHNVAVPGSTSPDWLPGSDYFVNRLEPLLADADVIFISLGGNDAMLYMNEALGDMAGAVGALNEFPAFVESIRDNVLNIAAAVRDVNPDLDIIYGIYPNYATSDMWIGMLGSFVGLIETTLDSALQQVRDTMDPADHIIVVDFYGAFADVDLDDYLYDELHFNAAGHEAATAEIFEALGGIRVGQSPLGAEHLLGVLP